LSCETHLGNARVHFSDLNGDGALQPFACNPGIPCVPLGNGGGYTEMLQVQHYYPFGMEFDGPWEMPLDPDEINHYTYNGKELNRDFGLGWLDYGARWYDAVTARWGQVDPLAEAFYSHSLYNYALNNPINFIDRDGKYPTPILVYDANLGLYGGYRFTKSAAHLLSLVSGVDKVYIENAVVQERAVGQYRPFYSASKGGGAITLGWNSIGATITYTENWFADDRSAYNGHGYGQDVYAWLALSSHEVGHLPQISREGGLFGYLAEFAKQYAQAGEHDGAPYEQEADEGYNNFVKFNSFVNSAYGAESLTDLFYSDKTQGNKIKTLNKWWGAYQESQSQKKTQATNSFLKNFGNLSEGTYEWNGSEWVKKEK
jgi:RHS repeat-associated protein